MNKKFVITIGRQFGSGGSEVGYKLSRKLGVKYYDKELIVNAARNSGMSQQVFEMEDETPTSSFLYSLVMAPYTAAAQYLNWSEESLNDKIFKHQADYIRKIASEESCVIIGRCADYVLWDNPDCIRIFLDADMEFRKHRIADDSKISLDKAEDIIRKNDKQRANYYNFHTNKRWGEVANYHFCVNVGAVGMDNTVELIKNYIELRDKE